MTPEMLAKKPHGKSIDWYGVGALMYECLVTVPPFFDPDEDRLNENILGAPLKLPIFISDDCQNLLKSLLLRNAQKRLGANSGFDEIKQHPWFRDVNWREIYNK